jgi:hypothetical protein
MKLYRVVDRNLGKKVDFRPKKGYVSSYYKFLNVNFGLDYPEMPARICCAPSIAQCVLAIPDDVFKSRRILRVYWTETKDYKNAPKKSEWDAPITQEKWLFKKKRFYLCGTLPREFSSSARLVLYGDDSGAMEGALTYKQRLQLHRFKLKAIQWLVKGYFEELK